MWPHIFLLPQILCLSRVRHMSSKMHKCTTEEDSGGGAQLHNCTTDYDRGTTAQLKKIVVEGHNCTTKQLHNCTNAQLHKCTNAQLHNCTTGGGAQLHPTSSWAALESRARLMGGGRHPNSPTHQPSNINSNTKMIINSSFTHKQVITHTFPY